MSSNTDFENDARKALAVFLARPVLIVVGIVAVAVFGLCWKQNADTNRDGRIEELTRQVARDSVVVDSLTKQSKLADTRVAAAVDTFVKREVVWRQHTDTLSTTVTRIVTSTEADSAKIRELTALITETQRKADDAIASANQIASASTDFRLKVVAERAGWEQQRSDMAAKIKLLEKQSRHWGLGATIGAGALRSSDGVIRAGPVLAIGIVYRY